MEIIKLTPLFVAVNLDFLVALLFLLTRFKKSAVAAGYMGGMALLWFGGALVGQGLQALLPTWVLGFLGFIPLYLAIKGDGDDDDDAEMNTTGHSHFWGGTVAVFLIYLGMCGADNLAVYLPVLGQLSLVKTIVCGLYFLGLAACSIGLASLVLRQPAIKNWFAKYSEPLARILYAAVGIFVLVESEALVKVWQLIF